MAVDFIGCMSSRGCDIVASCGIGLSTNRAELTGDGVAIGPTAWLNRSLGAVEDAVGRTVPPFDT